MIIQSLGQDAGTEVKDGMDMAVVSIDPENNILEFSGAQNPVRLVRNKELIQMNCDRMPISIHVRMDKFINQTTEIRKGDQIYLFLDGYADQFGGMDNKKLKFKAFKQLILDNSEKSMREQKIAMKKFFTKWKGDNEQVDDVVLIGVKI